MCNYIKKTQQNLVVLIEQLAMREQSSDLKNFLRRESCIPEGESEEEEKTSESNKTPSENNNINGVNDSNVKVKRSQSASLKGDMEFEEKVNEEEESDQDIDELFKDAIGEIQKASFQLNQTMRTDTEIGGDLDFDEFHDAIGDGEEEVKVKEKE